MLLLLLLLLLLLCVCCSFQVCHDSPVQASLLRGLAIVNTTSIEVFEHKQKSELFVVKARLHDKLGTAYASQAYTSFSHAIQALATYNKGWLAWGLFLDKCVPHFASGVGDACTFFV